MLDKNGKPVFSTDKNGKPIIPPNYEINHPFDYNKFDPSYNPFPFWDVRHWQFIAGVYYPKHPDEAQIITPIVNPVKDTGKTDTSHGDTGKKTDGLAGFLPILFFILLVVIIFRRK